MQSKQCVIIPAVKKMAVIPDQLVKKLNGVTLIQRAIDTAKKMVADKDIYIVTDSNEVALICDRNKVNVLSYRALEIKSNDILSALDFYIKEKADLYHHIVLFRANAPLINETDIHKGYETLFRENADVLITVKEEAYKLWKKQDRQLISLLSDVQKDQIHIESKAFTIISAKAAKNDQHSVVVPYVLESEKSIEIESYQHWWICEKLLQRKRIVFVVAGYPAIGMGHIFRSLTLAHEITEHEIIFLCTKESELALQNIASRDYKTFIQTMDLADEVIKLKPHLVINDILNTCAAYIKKLKKHGIKVVNFEDLKEGCRLADITFNELYDKPLFKSGKNIKWGHKYFFLRDEFAHSIKRPFRKKISTLLITFGGTDASNYSHKTLQTVIELCIANDININIVAGPGYLYKDKLKNLIVTYEEDIEIHYHDSVNVMSKIMEQTDIAICSAGRTVYELAHMNIPSIVMSHHRREDGHTFARYNNGFIYLGVMNPFNEEKLTSAFSMILQSNFRKKLYDRMRKFDFTATKEKVVSEILRLL